MRQTFAPKTARHDRGWGGRSHTLHVPLLSDGEWKQGFFRVPESFGGDEHTNAQHKANQYRVQKIRDWVEWYRRNGWELVGKPFVTDPILSPTEQAGGDPIDGEGMRVYVKAKFVRTSPMKMPLDLFLHKKEEAERYSVELEEARLDNPLPKPVAEIEEGNPVDPMEDAQKRREQLAIRRELIVEDGMATGANVIYETLPDSRHQDRDLE